MSEQQKFQTGRPKGKGIVRWHGAVSTNLANQHVLIPKEESSSESDSESFIVIDKKRKGFTHKVRAAFGKVLPPRQREDNGIKLLGNLRNDFPERQTRIPKIIQHLSLPREILKKPENRRSQAATLHLDVNVVEAETERITANNVLVRSKKLTRRVSVTSVPSGLQKGPYSAKKRHFAFNKKKKKTGDKVRFQSEYTVENLQMQVDDLIETIADKSTKLLAQRHAELQQCESLGDEILQSSKQFQRVSKKNTRKYQFKNVCFPCLCCY